MIHRPSFREFSLLISIILISLSLISCFGSSSKKSPLSDKEIIKKNVDNLTNKSAGKRRKAVINLGELGEKSRAAIPAMVPLLQDEHWKVRLSAVEALDRIGADKKVIEPGVLALLLDSHPGIRIHILLLIEEREISTSKILRTLERMAGNDPEEKVKIIADRTFRKLALKTIFSEEPAPTVSGPAGAAPEPQASLPTGGVWEVPNFYSSPRKHDVAVIIGIEDYLNIVQRSDYSYNDATLVKKYLLALGYQERNIEFITNERATLSGIKKALEAWLPNNARKDGRVFVFFSGHGAPDTKGTGYIVPYDGDPAYLAQTAYPLDTFYKRLNDLKAKEVIIVMDSCFSGAGGRSVLPSGARPMFIEVETPEFFSKKIVSLSSSEMKQISTSDPEMQLGLLTSNFLEALKNGKFSIADIYGYVQPRVQDAAKRKNIEQTPHLNPRPELLEREFSLR